MQVHHVRNESGLQGHIVHCHSILNVTLVFMILIIDHQDKDTTDNHVGHV